MANTMQIRCINRTERMSPVNATFRALFAPFADSAANSATANLMLSVRASIYGVPIFPNIVVVACVCSASVDVFSTGA